MKQLGLFIVAFMVLAVVPAQTQVRGAPPIGIPGPPPAVLLGPPAAVVTPPAAAVGLPPAALGPPPAIVMGPPPPALALPPALGLPHGLPGGLPAAMGGPPGLLGPAANAPGQIVRSVQAAADAVGRPGSAPILAANLARDEHGAVIVRAELLAVGPDEASMQITERLGFTIVRRDSLGALGLATATLRVPEGMSAIDALALLRKADPKGIYDYAHVYNPSGGNSKNIAAAAASSSESSMAGAGLRVGMIDGGIDKRHPAFRNASLMTEAFAQHAAAQGTVHGTAVASLLVGHDGSFSGYLPGATLYAADVFAGAPDGGSADIIARALDWLAANNIAVTNISLAGPPNLLLEAAVKAFIARGHTLVAAAGNGGPAAPLNYPAAYPGVVAVTSVDSNRRPELDANRGAQFAALGVDVRAATLPDGYASVTGTSYAAPAVTARFALVLPSPDAAKAKLAINQLSQTAIPLGAMKNAPKYLDASTSMDSPAATSVGAR